MKNQGGFTLIELVLVITILGILAVAALPSFINVSSEAKQSAMTGVVGAVRSGINLYKANDLVKNGPPGVYPAPLDAAVVTDLSTAVPYFTAVLAQGVGDKNWTKSGNVNTYIYTLGGGQSCSYAYNSTTGTFTGTGSGGATCP